MITKNDIIDPAMNYRPVPFWSWNDKLEPEELRYQIREMHKAGLGGFFMHARGGLQTVYLSDEWMECVNACLDEAGKLGMEAWLYDENGWPSGFGGGLVNGLGVKYQQKYLRCEKKLLKDCGTENTVAYYDADGNFLSRTAPANPEAAVIRCYFEVNPYYVDNLDAEVVAEFIRVTHKFYYENIPANLLKSMKGIFTDEPQISRNGTPWSFVYEREYKKEYGRELIEELPFLFYPGKEHHEIRIRFWKLTAKLFNINFMKQIHDWCDAHGWMLTGHHVIEENLGYMTPGAGETRVVRYDAEGNEVSVSNIKVSGTNFKNFQMINECSKCLADQGSLNHYMSCGHYSCEVGREGHGDAVCGTFGHYACDGADHSICYNCQKGLCNGREHGFGVCPHVHTRAHFAWDKKPTCQTEGVERIYCPGCGSCAIVFVPPVDHVMSVANYCIWCGKSALDIAYSE